MPQDIVQTALRGKGSAPRLLIALAITALALIGSSLIFYYSYREGCAGVASWKFCKFSTHFFERALAVLVLGALYAVARPDRVAPLGDAVRASGPTGPAWVLVGGGALCVVAPPLMMAPDLGGAGLLASVTLWAVGVAMLAGGVLRLIAPFSAWWRVLVQGLPVLPVLLGVALFLPEIGDALFPLWQLDRVTDATFQAVIWAGGLVGLELVGFVDTHDIGQGDFWVQVGQSCSGIEGFALVTVFLSGYAILFRSQLNMWRVLLILPLGLLLSWILNITRITMLIWIGIHVSPTLAIEGFHSHAGWLVFSLLSLGIIAVVHNVPWFRLQDKVRTAAPAAPLAQDWNAARILPFAVFMFSALLASTFFQTPSVAYPARFALMVGAVWLFRAQIMALPWRLSPLAVGSGALIGALWLLTSPASASQDLAPALAAMSPMLFAGWVATRILGTSLVVPIIEELFFRSYLIDRLSGQGTRIGLAVALAISTGAFAVLHDRWLAAALAGLIFAWLAIRPGGRITDAIVSHMVANALIAGWALVIADWSVI
ncbi:MAG: exosortase E/protease, VPEID-CTERM system [Marinibacterium sp.]|nr:exosortase E/protease, VPEID-CTERM system [Marinibacterium sp.]